MTYFNYQSPAKLNLFLHINAKRADGYHELQTQFLLIDRCDDMRFSVRDDADICFEFQTSHRTDSALKGGITTNDVFGHLTLDEAFKFDNLVVRAAKLLKAYSNCPMGVDIVLGKNLPLGGGLGGGSSNAATTLIVLNQLWQLDLPKKKLIELAAKLGADVPVFVHGCSAWADGIGDKLICNIPSELRSSSDAKRRHILVLTPSAQVSTAELFAHPKLPRSTPKYKLSDYQLEDPKFGNDFEALVLARYPAIKTAHAYLSQYQDKLIMPARLTGTGASIFGIFQNAKEAKQALYQAPCAGFVTAPLVHSPYV